MSTKPMMRLKRWLLTFSTKKRLTSFMLTSSSTCLNGIQSTKMKEVRNGMTKDVLYRFGREGYKSDKKMKGQQDRRVTKSKRSPKNPRSSRSVCSMVQKSPSSCFPFTFYRTPTLDAIISYLFGPWCGRPSMRTWTRFSPSRVLLVGLLDRLRAF